MGQELPPKQAIRLPEAFGVDIWVGGSPPWAVGAQEGGFVFCLPFLGR